MSKKILCPACGSNKIIETQIAKKVNEPFGGERQVPIKEYSCEICEFSGDLFSENDKALQDAINSLQKDAIVNILNTFLENKISLSSIERALELPQRTLTKWKSGFTKPSSSGVALLKFLKLFPWLLEVAENKYDYATSQRIQMTSAFQEMLKCMDFTKNNFAGAGVVKTGTSAIYYMHVDRPNNELKAVNNADYIDTEPEVRLNFVGN